MASLFEEHGGESMHGTTSSSAEAGSMPLARSKTIGVIGGMGPETTAGFYLRIIDLCRERGVPVRPAVSIFSVPLPLALESAALSGKGGVEPYLPILLDAAIRLERSGADFIVMPCNSMHVFIEQIRASVRIPVHSIVDASMDYLSSRGFGNVMLLATSITSRSKLYETAAKARPGLAVRVPSAAGQERLDSVVVSLVSGSRLPWQKDALRDAIEAAEGCDCVLLACTDLQILEPVSDRIAILDTMEILAQRAVDQILS